jgi:serine/threonine-protein kinase
VINVIKKVLLDDPVSPRRKNPIIEKDLATVCLKALEKERERRYESSESFAQDLENYLSGEPITARPASLRYRLVKKAKRHRAIVSTIAAALVLLVTVVVIGIQLLAKSERDKLAERALTQEEKLGKEAAENRALLKEKAERSYRVLMTAIANLGDVHSELKRTFNDTSKLEEDRKSVFHKHRNEINTVLAPFLHEITELTLDDRIDGQKVLKSGARSEAATSLSLLGWLLWHGGMSEQAFSAFKKSQELDPDIPWGFLFESMVYLSKYLALQEIPAETISGSEIRFNPFNAENDEARVARELFESKVDISSKTKVLDRKATFTIKKAIDGLVALRSKDWVKSENGLSCAINVPEFLWIREELFLARARVRYFQNKFQEALEDIQKFLKKHPRSAIMLRRKGKILLAQGITISKSNENKIDKFRKAIESFNVSIRLNPRFDSAYISRGNSYMYLGISLSNKGENPIGSYKEAINDGETALKIDQNNFEALILLGSVNKCLGENMFSSGKESKDFFDKAIDYGLQAVRIDPKRETSHFNLGNTYLSFGESLYKLSCDPREVFMKALDKYRDALSINPDSVCTLMNRAVAWRWLGDGQRRYGNDPVESYMNAIKEFGDLLRRDPNKVVIYINRGTTYRHLGEAQSSSGEDPRENYRKAIEDHSEAIRKGTDDAGLRLNRGNAYWLLAEEKASRGINAKKDYLKAIDDFSKSYQFDPKYSVSLESRANAFISLGELADKQRNGNSIKFYRMAISDCIDALHINSESADGFAILGDAYSRFAAEEKKEGLLTIPAGAESRCNRF